VNRRNGILVLSIVLALASALLGGGWSWDSPVL
jgi:hypothetical protein